MSLLKRCSYLTLLGIGFLFFAVHGQDATTSEIPPSLTPTDTSADAQEIYQPDTQITAFDVKTAHDTLQEMQGSIQTMTNELDALDQKEFSGSQASTGYREVRQDIVDVIQNINTTTQVVDEKLTKIDKFKTLIQTAYDDLTSSRQGFQATKEYLQTFTSFVYKLDNKMYNENTDTIDDVKLIVNSDNIPRSLANDYMAKSIMLQFTDLLSGYTTHETQQIQLIKKLRQLENQARDDIQEYQTSLDKIQQKRNYLMQFIALYKNDNSQRMLTISSLFESTKAVYDKIAELSKEIQKKDYSVDFDMESKIQELADVSNDTEVYPVAWPIYPIENILTYFWDANYQKQYGIPHIGIQIQAQQGTPVYAARDGIVYFVADSDTIGINRVMVVHTDGYVSAYEYLNTTLVKPWDIVQRGQLLWYSGGEPGTRGAGFISKWSNLTFVLLKDGVAIDPFDVLDASIVQNQTALPDGYQIKYLRDKYARPIDITNLTLMTGETIIDREDQFLKRYGVGVYQQVPFWADVVKDTNIDRDVVICIAFAESTLGHYLSTAGNIGNVGNNDRGDRVPFASAYEGARAIPLTLNNAFLGNYHTIKQLSRYGNKDGKIYASSPINWQTNVLKCLSQIKWYYIPEDFPFRTGPNPNLQNTSAPETVVFASGALSQ